MRLHAPVHLCAARQSESRQLADIPKPKFTAFSTKTKNLENPLGIAPAVFALRPGAIGLPVPCRQFDRLGRCRSEKSRISVSEGEHYECRVLVERSEIIYVEPPNQPEAAKIIQHSGAEHRSGETRIPDDAGGSDVGWRRRRF